VDNREKNGKDKSSRYKSSRQGWEREPYEGVQHKSMKVTKKLDPVSLSATMSKEQEVG
jgi:hypothetical protein